MTRKEAIRQTEQERTLMSLGFTSAEAEQLRRISMTLHRWHELECGDGNGCVEYDNEDDSGRAYWLNSNTGKRRPMPNRGAGARRRLDAIVKARNERECDHSDIAHGETCKIHDLHAYIQTDPRGAALYILRPGDVPNGCDVSSYYTRGICVY